MFKTTLAEAKRDGLVLRGCIALVEDPSSAPGIHFGWLSTNQLQGLWCPSLATAVILFISINCSYILKHDFLKKVSKFQCNVGLITLCSIFVNNSQYDSKLSFGVYLVCQYLVALRKFDISWYLKFYTVRFWKSAKKEWKTF